METVIIEAQSQGYSIGQVAEIYTVRKQEDMAMKTNNYALLDRLRSDCEYYLGYGKRNANCLWARNEQEQINKMRELYDLLPEKPEWLTREQIDEYAAKII